MAELGLAHDLSRAPQDSIPARRCQFGRAPNHRLSELSPRSPGIVIASESLQIAGQGMGAQGCP